MLGRVPNVSPTSRRLPSDLLPTSEEFSSVRVTTVSMPATFTFTLSLYLPPEVHLREPVALCAMPRARYLLLDGMPKLEALFCCKFAFAVMTPLLDFNNTSKAITSETLWLTRSQNPQANQCYRNGTGCNRLELHPQDRRSWWGADFHLRLDKRLSCF